MKKTTYTTILTTIIREHRKAQGLRNKDMAEALGIVTSSYLKIETGASSFSFGRVVQALRKLEVSLETTISQLDDIVALLIDSGWEVVDELSVTEDDLIRYRQTCRRIGFTPVGRPFPWQSEVKVPEVIAFILAGVKPRPSGRGYKPALSY